MYSFEVLPIVTNNSILHVAGFVDLPPVSKKTEISNVRLARSFFAQIFSVPLLKAIVWRSQRGRGNGWEGGGGADSLQVSFGKLQLLQISFTFETTFSILKIRELGKKTFGAFFYLCFVF